MSLVSKVANQVCKQAKVRMRLLSTVINYAIENVYQWFIEAIEWFNLYGLIFSFILSRFLTQYSMFLTFILT